MSDRQSGASFAGVLRAHWPAVLVAVLALALLSVHLGQTVFWGDEAETALLGRNTLQYGVPLAWDGRNLVESLGRGSNWRYVWNQQPWVQFYLVAGSFATFGESAAAARLPFALAGWLAIVLTYVLVLKETGGRWQALVSMAILAANVQFLLFARQCRYPALLALGVVLALLAWRRSQRLWGWVWLALAGAFLFHSNYLAFFPTLGACWLYALVWQRNRRTLANLAVATGVIAAVSLTWALYAGVIQGIRGQVPAKDVLETLSWIKTYVARVSRWMIPMVLVLGVIVALARKAIPERRLVLLCLLILFAHVVFVPVVAPALVLRYAAGLFPVAAILVGALLAALWRWRKAVAVTVGVLFLATHLFSAIDVVVTNLVKLPFTRAPFANRWLREDVRSGFLRREYVDYLDELVRGQPDNVNAGIIAFVREHVRDDELVASNHDWLPIIFYTDARVMGAYIRPSSRHGWRSMMDQLPGYASNPWDEEVFWFIPRDQDSLPALLSDIREREAQGEWTVTAYPTDIPDLPHGNDPEIDSRVRRAPEAHSRITCYRVERIRSRTP